MSINVEQKAKEVLATLYEIQPRINISGLTEESEKLAGMRADLQVLVAELHEDNRRLERVVGAMRDDALSSFVELKQLVLSTMSQGVRDEAMQQLAVTAENFAGRCYEYLDGKARLAQQPKKGGA